MSAVTYIPRLKMITGAEEIALVWFHLVILLSLFPTVFTVHSYLLKTTTTRLPLSLYPNLANEKGWVVFDHQLEISPRSLGKGLIRTLL